MPNMDNTFKAEASEETEEEHAVRLARISEEVKADMKAGRYRHGQLRPEISAKQKHQELGTGGLHLWHRDIMDLLMKESMGTMSGRFSRREPTFYEMYGTSHRLAYLDESSDIPRYKEITDGELRGQEKDGPKKPYWTQPIPEKGEETPPSDAKRAKLRAKRKKR